MTEIRSHKFYRKTREEKIEKRDQITEVEREEEKRGHQKVYSSLICVFYLLHSHIYSKIKFLMYGYVFSWRI